jgi:ABC-type amino acid transport substrate-binding protein
VSIKRIAASMVLTIMVMTVTFKPYTHAQKSENSYNNSAINAKSNTPFKETIVIGDDLDYPPYSFLDSNGRPAGFNIELAEAISEVMGFNIEFRLGNWNEVMKELKAGKIHAISGMFYSAEREKDYSFTTKHTVTSGDIFTRKETSISDIRELQGGTVVVQADDIIHEYLKNQNLNIKFIEVSTVAEALRLVSSRKYDFAAVLKVPGHYLVNNLKLTNLKPNGLYITPDDYCMAVQKGNEDLLLDLNGGLQILKATGRYDEIYDKWLGIYEKRSYWQVVEDYSLWIASILSAVLILFS